VLLCDQTVAELRKGWKKDIKRESASGAANNAPPPIFLRTRCIVFAWHMVQLLQTLMTINKDKWIHILSNVQDTKPAKVDAIKSVIWSHTIFGVGGLIQHTVSNRTFVVADLHQTFTDSNGTLVPQNYNFTKEGLVELKLPRANTDERNKTDKIPARRIIRSGPYCTFLRFCHKNVAQFTELYAGSRNPTMRLITGPKGAPLLSNTITGCLTAVYRMCGLNEADHGVSRMTATMLRHSDSTEAKMLSTLGVVSPFLATCFLTDCADHSIDIALFNYSNIPQDLRYDVGSRMLPVLTAVEEDGSMMSMEEINNSAHRISDVAACIPASARGAPGIPIRHRRLRRHYTDALQSGTALSLNPLLSLCEAAYSEIDDLQKRVCTSHFAGVGRG
jgi:hypothetical protein